jgi:hypothetical protein
MHPGPVFGLPKPETILRDPPVPIGLPERVGVSPSFLLLHEGRSYVDSSAQVFSGCTMSFAWKSKSGNPGLAQRTPP